MSDLWWRFVCWLIGHRTIAAGKSPPEGWNCWWCDQAVYQ